MINCTVNDIPFKVPEFNEWSGVTIEQAEKLFEIVSRFPEEEIKMHKILAKPQTPDQVDELQEHLNELSDEYLVKTMPMLYAEVIVCLSDGLNSVDDVKSWPPQAITKFYRKYLQNFTHTMIMGLPMGFEPIKVDGFWIGQEYVLFPDSSELLGREIPMVDVTALEFTESADLQVAALGIDKDFRLLRNVITILCRPQGEEYDEDVSLKRAESIGKLTMDKAWSVFFYLIRASNYALTSRLTSLLEGMRKRQE